MTFLLLGYIGYIVLGFGYLDNEERSTKEQRKYMKKYGKEPTFGYLDRNDHFVVTKVSHSYRSQVTQEKKL